MLVHQNNSTLTALEQLQEYRRGALLALMEEISETCWRHKWTAHLDRHLWRMVFEDGPREFGVGLVEEYQLALLQYYAEQTGTWWTAGDRDRAWDRHRITLDEARTRFSEREAV